MAQKKYKYPKRLSFATQLEIVSKLAEGVAGKVLAMDYKTTDSVISHTKRKFPLLSWRESASQEPQD